MCNGQGIESKAVTSIALTETKVKALTNFKTSTPSFVMNMKQKNILFTLLWVIVLCINEVTGSESSCSEGASDPQCGDSAEATDKQEFLHRWMDDAEEDMKEEGDSERKENIDNSNTEEELDHGLLQYQSMFDESGKVNHKLFVDHENHEVFDSVVEVGGSSQHEGVDEDQIESESTTTPGPLYKVKLSSVYEDNMQDPHITNKAEQKLAMEQFMAGTSNAGEMGNGIKLEEMDISENTKKELMFIDHAFNEYISNIISLNRTLPDRRHSWCKLPTSQFAPTENLPKTSVIFCFHNEAWSTLIRSIYSVINRSPDFLLHEIILVDDASTMEHLKDDLDKFVASSEKVKLIRLPTRQGLVRTRMAGIRAAEAETLTFLDSHIEVTDGWLEPLLDRVARNYKTVACPVIEAIDEKTFQYKFVTRDLMGTFNWKLEFDWSQISEEQQSSRVHHWAPYNSPTMAGGLFSISKEWFEQIGLYDEGMEIWGGENLEMSFRQWMCGGSIEIVPCSRVGHVFRSWSPYPWRTDINVLTYNPLRVAEVWMDDYKYLYYDRFGRWNKPLNQRVGNFGDVSDRVALREKLQCNSFQWYLSEVAIEVPQHQLFASGEIFNMATSLCLDQEDKRENVGKEIVINTCSMRGGNMYWIFRTDGKITRDYLCIGLGEKEGVKSVELVPCQDHTAWDYNSEENLLSYRGTSTCLSLSLDGTHQLGVADCDGSNDLQKWFFTHYNPGKMEYIDLA